VRRVFFYERAAKVLGALDKKAAARIVTKLEWLARHPDAESVTAKIENAPVGLAGIRRLRVGDYRVILWLDDEAIAVYALGHRADVYDILKRK
jgi:mRNA-degrading endonuclease RelE of RelBE toxin-antitoxin system